MRISRPSGTTQLLADLRMRSARFARAQQEAVSGLRILTPSDDPVGSATLARIESRVAEIEQFRRNGVSARVSLEAESGALHAAREVVLQARELARGATGLAPGDPLRAQIVQQVQLLRQELVSLGNTRMGDDFLFGGTASTAPPFLADGTYQGNLGTREAEVDDGTRVVVRRNGQPGFGAAIQALVDIETQVTSGDGTAINTAATAADQAARGLLGLESDAGSRIATVERAANRIATEQSTLLTRRDAIRSVDPAEAAVRLRTEQQALEQAYAVTARALELNLLDFLR
ncbi:MAG: hypothetical protein HOP12_06760 [Candidatus Eisenbacteria bacterium]|uniref:Flagellin n=1 Tax=Eiseniibacteriota bacterium TaxID=2212470 RepID=A0A849SMM3_UNCEI|nr:hypothetical protein [Candidatus Eisenbacteria bacterium]